MNLIELGTGVFALAHPEPSFGYSNVGLVIDADGLTVYDTTATPQQGLVVRDSILNLTAALELPIKRVVLSSSRVPFSGGGNTFWAAAFYGTEATSEQLDLPPNPEAFRRLLPSLSSYYSDDFTTRPITHTVAEPALLTAATSLLPLPGESAGNLAMEAESAGALFAGALASFGVTPLAFDASLVEWIQSLRQIGSRADLTVVPGHGRVGGAADVNDQADYLQACSDAAGNPSAIPAGPWDDWTDRRFDEVNVERAALLAQGIDDPPQSMFRLLGFE